MKYLCTIFIAFIHTVSSQDDIKMTADVISSYYQPTSVLVRVCWKTAPDWILMMDMYEKQYKILGGIGVSSSRPNLFLYSKHLRHVIIVELTVPWETNIPRDNTFKLNKYYDLTNELTRNKFVVNLYAVEVGAGAKKRKLVQLLHNLSPPKVLQFIKTVEDISCSSQKDTLIVAEANCPESREFFRRVNITQKFRSPYRWFIIDTLENKQKKIPLELEDLNILVDSDVLFTQKNDSGYTLFMPYKCSSNSTWKLETFGTWTYGQGLNKFYDMNIPKPRRRRNLGGIPFGTSFVMHDNNTKNDLTNLRNLKTDHLLKTGYLQMVPLYYFMNATFITVFTDDWGYLINGTFNGMISDVIRGKAELTGTVIFPTKSRLDVVDFLTSPVPSTVKFVFRQPSLSLQNNLFVLPFKPTVWLCIFCLIFLLLLVVFVNVQWENFKCRDIENLNKSKLDKSEVVMMVLGAITLQGSFSEFKGILGRVVMFLMFFVFLFLHTSYSANIVALLQSSSNDIKTLTDLLNSRLELGAEDTAYNRQFMSSVNETVRKAIYQKKIAPPGSKPNFMSLEEGVKRFQKQPFAFHMFLGVGYGLVEKYFQEHEKCGLKEIQFNFVTIPYVTCRKNSPYKKIFKIGLLRNEEHGLNKRVYRMIYTPRPVCTANGGTFDSVNMIDFYPALLLLAYGIIASVIFLVLEHFVSKRLSQKKNTKF